MAVNEKPVYATDWTTHGKHLFRPGEQMTGRVDPEIIRHAQESGLATESRADAERAKGAEAERRRNVEEQIARRSEKRDYNPREDRR